MKCQDFVVCNHQPHCPGAADSRMTARLGWPGFRYLGALLLSAFFLLASFNVLAGRPVPPLVSAEWLAQELTSPDLVVLDVRLPEDYAMGHVEGAVNVPYTVFFEEGFMMPGMNELAEIFSKAGIDHDQRVVIYDDGAFIWAARAYWLLETLGLRQVGMLDVGFGNWVDAVLPESTKARDVPARRFVPEVNHRKLATRIDTLMSMDNPQRVIMDGRSYSEYMGEESLAKRFGHIPGAVHYSWSGNFRHTGSGNQMFPLDDLAPRYEGLNRDQHIVIYCNGGAQSAVNYIVLQALGFSVSVYDGSWVEWGNDESLPVHNPSQPEQPLNGG